MPVKKIYEPVDDTHCPNCNSLNINWNGYDWTGGHHCFNDSECTDCGTTFTVVYVVVPISLVQDLTPEEAKEL